MLILFKKNEFMWKSAYICSISIIYYFHEQRHNLLHKKVHTCANFHENQSNRLKSGDFIYIGTNTYFFICRLKFNICLPFLVLLSNIKKLPASKIVKIFLNYIILTFISYPTRILLFYDIKIILYDDQIISCLRGKYLSSKPI